MIVPASDWRAIQPPFGAIRLLAWCPARLGPQFRQQLPETTHPVKVWVTSLSVLSPVLVT